MKESLEKEIKYLRTAINPAELERTPPLEEPHSRALFETLTQAIDKFETKYRESKGTKKPWEVFRTQSDTFIAELASRTGKELEPRQRPLAEAVLRAPEMLKRKNELYEILKKQRFTPPASKEFAQLKSRALTLEREEAEWQHRIAAFILIHEQAADLEEKFGTFWHTLSSLNARLLSPALRQILKEQGKNEDIVEEDRLGIIRLVSAVELLRYFGQDTLLPTREQDVKENVDLYTIASEGAQLALFGIQVKPPERKMDAPLRFALADAENLPPDAKSVFEIISRNLRELKRRLKLSFNLPIRAGYLELPSARERKDISHATGIPSASFLKEAAASLDATVKKMLRSG